MWAEVSSLVCAPVYETFFSETSLLSQTAGDSLGRRTQNKRYGIVAGPCQNPHAECQWADPYVPWLHSFAHLLVKDPNKDPSLPQTVQFDCDVAGVHEIAPDWLTVRRKDQLEDYGTACQDEKYTFYAVVGDRFSTEQGNQAQHHKSPLHQNKERATATGSPIYEIIGGVALFDPEAKSSKK